MPSIIMLDSWRTLSYILVMLSSYLTMTLAYAQPPPYPYGMPSQNQIVFIIMIILVIVGAIVLAVWFITKHKQGKAVR